MDVRTWVERQRSSHDRRDREEAKALAAMTPDERSQLLRALSVSALKAMLAASGADEALAFREPLPESSVRAWARLRAHHAGHAARR